MGKRLIIINRMYAGKYLTLGENIGHEVINLVRTDKGDGDNFLWLNADGNCDISRFIKKNQPLYDEIIMLMVRMYGRRTWKVLAKAEIDTEHLAQYMVPSYTAQDHQKQLEIIQREHIYYGGQPVDRIFSNNISNGLVTPDTDIYFTFKAKDLRLPVCSVENIDKTIVSIEGLKGLHNRSLRMYLTDKDNVETYEFFRDIVDGKRFDWEQENTTQKVDPQAVADSIEEDYFLRILNEEYRELSFSNLLAYFLANPKIMGRFAESVLGIPNFNTENYSVTREEKNIDLFLASPDYYIILENKIRSSLICKNNSEAARKKITEFFVKSKKDAMPEAGARILERFQDAKTYYQTDIYYAYAAATIHHHNSDAQIRGFVLCPNYQLPAIRAQLETALFREHFAPPLSYRQVYEFFSELTDSEYLSPKERLYLQEFLAAMKIHAKDVDSTLEEEMFRRFHAIIQSSRTKNP